MKQSCVGPHSMITRPVREEHKMKWRFVSFINVI